MNTDLADVLMLVAIVPMMAIMTMLLAPIAFMAVSAWTAARDRNASPGQPVEATPTPAAPTPTMAPPDRMSRAA